MFEIYTYKNSLRFNILLDDSPSPQEIDELIDKIKQNINDIKKDTIMLWYSQVNGFSNELLDKLEHFNPYHFYKFQIASENINTEVDMKGLTKRPFTQDMADTCIDVLEDVFTPFPDASGSFRNDKERILSEFQNVKLFYKGEELVGFCGHNDGHFTETVVRKEFQGQGYGEVIVRSTLKSVYESGNDAYLYVGHHNERAIALYKKVGFTKVYESKRVNLYG